jgi:hypothetical protein
MFEALCVFYKKNGHSRPGIAYSVNGLKLGEWVRGQRSRSAKLTTERKRRLDELEFYWDVKSDLWEEAFTLLEKFRNREGHCSVSQSHREKGKRLGVWVTKQRQKKGLLTRTQIKRLEDIGFSWDPLTERWNQAFYMLKRFRNKNGHCRVPYSHVIDDFNLGSWVNTQRQYHDKLGKNRVSLLNSVGFVWVPLKAQWESALTALEKFRKREGHCDVPQSHVEDEIRLGAWVSQRRYKKAQLTKEKLAQLNSLGFIWKK